MEIRGTFFMVKSCLDCVGFEVVKTISGGAFMIVHSLRYSGSLPFFFVWLPRKI